MNENTNEKSCWKWLQTKYRAALAVQLVGDMKSNTDQAISPNILKTRTSHAHVFPVRILCVAQAASSSNDGSNKGAGSFNSNIHLLPTAMQGVVEESWRL